MNIERFTLFFRGLEIEARIGIHDFERKGPQRLTINVEVDINLSRLPVGDDIAETFDYDWIRTEILRLVEGRHFELQETLAQAIIHRITDRPEVVRVVVETAKPDVFADVAAVGCRIEARR